MNVSQADILKSFELLDNSIDCSRKSIFRVKPSTARTLLERRKKELSDVTRMQYSIEGRSLANLSSTLPAFDPSLMDATFPEDVSRGANTADILFQYFLESLQKHASERRLFDTVVSFIEHCNNVVQEMRDSSNKQNKTKLKDNLVVKERNTWRLVYCLYQNRLGPQPEETDLGPLRRRTEKEIADDLFKSDSVVREYQLVVDWLEQNAGDQYFDDEKKAVLVQHFTDKTLNWENTIHCLQNKGKSIPYSGPENLVTEVDPDAPFRQKKVLHPFDEADDQLLEKKMFDDIRSGCLDGAQSLCKRCGCYWRAALLEGWRLFHDPNLDDDITDAEKKKKQADGNRRRGLWKLMAWNIIEKQRLSATMNAILGAFCGHLRSLLEVSETWDDMLWAYLRVIVDIRVEKEIRATSTHHYEGMPDQYWENLKPLQDIFKDLASSNIIEVKNNAADPMHIVQQMLILNEIAALMEKIATWICDSEPHFLRFLAHLVLFFRMAGLSKHDNIVDMVLEAYIKVLMKRRQSQLVAYYVSLLPQEDQVSLFSQFLLEVTNPDERLTSLADAEDAGLDVLAITKKTVEKIRAKVDTEQDIGLQHEGTVEDLQKVSALDWLTFYSEQRFELVWQTNAVIRQFIASGKLEMAQKALNKIPADSLNLIIQQYHTSGDEEPFSFADVNSVLPPQVADTCREYLCISAYLNAEEAFSNWFEYFHNAKPRPPLQPASNANFAERVAYEQRENIYRNEMDRWRTALLHQTKAAKDKLTNVLTFPSGGWMVDTVALDKWELCDEEIEEAKLRKKQMDGLRQLCIPKVVLLLHTLLHKTGDYQDCLQLADLIVDEHYGLYKVYTVEGLQDFLAKICESSLEMLHQKRDPWGFVVTS